MHHDVHVYETLHLFYEKKFIEILKKKFINYFFVETNVKKMALYKFNKNKML